MESKIYKVVARTATTTINAAGKEMPKCQITLQELDRFGNTYIASMLGDDTKKVTGIGDLVAVVLRFSVFEYNGRSCQDITVSAIEKVGNAVQF